MDELLLRLLRGETTPEEDDRVAAWLEESSPERSAELKALDQILTLARVQDERLDPGEPPLAARLIHRAGGETRSTRRTPWYRPPAWAVASLATAAAAAFLVLSPLADMWWGTGGGTSRLVAEEFITGAGESATVRMSDETVVRLGPESSLQVMADGTGRQLVLVGRAFFAVARDEKHPFRVYTPSGNLRVLGTRFQVEADVEGMRLVVVDGSVALATTGSEVEVGAGEMTRVTSGKISDVQKAPGLAELSSDWMGQFLAFQKTPLSRAAQEIQEIYNVEVRVVDPDLNDKTVTMWFSSRPLEDVLTVLCSVVEASCGIHEGVVSIAKREP